MAKLPPLRRSAASRLRDLAHRLDPGRQTIAARSSAPLIRIGGRWWYRDEIAPALPQSSVAPDARFGSESDH
jgi:hypothetical protein